MNIVNKIKEYFNHVNDITQMLTSDNIEKIISYIKQIPILCTINIDSANNKNLGTAILKNIIRSKCLKEKFIMPK